jgi:HAE1 family hydrophobic/amphiphilic exporter-1
METSVTEVVEDSLNTISGIEELRSTTMEGVAIIVVQFDLSKDEDVGVQEVRDKINAIQSTLPDGVEPPVVSKFETDAIPILTLAVSGQRDFREVTEIARRKIKERLETVSGVGSIQLAGGRTRAMNVIVDTDKLAAYGLSIDEVRTALVRQNQEVPGGRLDQGAKEQVLRILGRLDTAREFNDLIISSKNGYPVRVRDIGRAEDGVEEPRSTARLNGENAVSLVVQKQSGTNTVAVAHAIKERLAELQDSLPPDVKTIITRDQSRFIEQSIEEVKFHLLLAGVLVSATILLFIQDWRTTVIATLAIPTSIIPTFLFMDMMGFTLNNITMLGLILAIGIVIDDAVVVHENIFRHMEEDGMDGMTASRIGTREIALPVLATSLSLIVIFLPIAFIGGIIGRFFASFGFVVAFAVAMSLFVSFTLTPMLCSRFLKLEPRHEGQESASSKDGFIYRIIDRMYGAILRLGLKLKWLVVILAFVTIGATVPIGMATGFSLIPRDDQSEYEVAIRTPEGLTLEQTEKIVNDLERRVRALPETKDIFTTVGSLSTGGNAKGQGDVTQASMYVRMNDLHDRTISQFEVQDMARAMLLDFPDLRASVNDVSPFQGGSRAQTFQINLAGPELDKLAGYAEQLKDRLAATGGLTDLDTTISLSKPEVRVRIDREAAADLGLPVSTIADTLRVLVGGLPISTFRDGGEQYDVWLRADQKDRNSLAALNSLSLSSPTVGPVKLASVADLDEDLGPTEIERLARERIVTVLGNPTEKMTLNAAITTAQQILDEIGMEPGYRSVVSGQGKTLQETFLYFTVAFVLSAVFMYLILAAQFESWLQPVAIMMALPVTIPFGLLSMILWRTPMDLYAMFGLFMLVGIVKKNGILQVNSTNDLRKEGWPRFEAIVAANHLRLRPILMTTIMLVAAMVPIALGRGPGSGSRASMAKVIIGGQMLSLVLALVVTPVFYIILDQWVNFLKRKGVRFSVHHEPPAEGDDSPAAPAPGLIRLPEKAGSAV